MGIGLKKAIFRYLFMTCSLFACLPAVMSQEVKQDTSTVEIDGREFYKYVVEPGNTLYSISRKYNVTVYDLEKFNPKASQGLSIGDTLYILAVEKDPESIKTRMEVDGDIIVHEVQKKQTLYAISKIYGISVGDIMEVNPEIKKGLKEGQLIKIPISKLKEEEEQLEIIDDGRYLIHEVQSKETLYSLSKFYSVPIDSIKAANEGLPEGLKVGQLISIPKNAITHEMPDSSVIKDRYTVVFILPFFLDLNDTLISKLKIDDEERVMSKSVIALQFYEGALLAIDSMKNLGMQFDIKFFDSAKDTLRINEIIKGGELDDADLIIGPFYLSQFMRVSEYAREKKIHIVCPVPQNNKILLGNPYVSKVATSKNVMFRNLGKYSAYLFKDQNILMLEQSFRANPLSLAYKDSYIRTLNSLGDTASLKNIGEVKWDKGSVDPIRAKLKGDSVRNIIVVPSNDQVYVTKLMAGLNNLSEKYRINIIGLDTWLKYSNIDFDYLEHLGVMIPVNGHINYQRSEVNDFVRRYQKQYEIFPEKFAFQGFDVTWYYLNQLEKNGNRIEQSMVESNEKYLYFNFNFFKTGMESGYENSSTVLLQYREYQLNEVPVLNE